MYARINLSGTNYDINSLGLDARLLLEPNVKELSNIYYEYVSYKMFPSVMPLFTEEYTYSQSDVVGYYDNNNLVAFTLMFKYNSKNVAAAQFAWTYHKPKLRLGFRSLEWLCAWYKSLEYDYIYLGDDAEYKRQLDGFEVLGPRLIRPF
jgi:hypothetical protein